jgi:hypothetical protein
METKILDALLDFLGDGNWHTLNEISTHEPLLHLTMSQLAMILNLLSEYDFIESEDYFPDGIIEAKINPKVAKFWRKIKWIERTGVKEDGQ